MNDNIDSWIFQYNSTFKNAPPALDWIPFDEDPWKNMQNYSAGNLEGPRPCLAPLEHDAMIQCPSTDVNPLLSQVQGEDKYSDVLGALDPLVNFGDDMLWFDSTALLETLDQPHHLKGDEITPPSQETWGSEEKAADTSVTQEIGKMHNELTHGLEAYEEVRRLREELVQVPEIHREIGKLREELAQLPEIHREICKLREELGHLPDIHRQICKLREELADVRVIHEEIQKLKGGLEDVQKCSIPTIASYVSSLSDWTKSVATEQESAMSETW